MTERSAWFRIRKQLTPYGRLVRVENAAEAGTPDVCYCLLGVTGWLELKYLTRWPARGEYLRVPSLTAAQVTWLARWETAGGRAHLLLSISDEDVLLAPLYARLLLAGELSVGLARGYVVKRGPGRLAAAIIGKSS